MADKLPTKNRFLTYLSLTRHMLGLNIAAAAEYRTSFITQTVGIMLNDASHVLVWFIFFQRFQTLNGWHFQEIMLLSSVFFTSFGVLAILTGGLMELAKYIAKGDLDYFLTFPKNALWHSAVSRIDISGIGDALLGILLFVFFCGPLNWEKILMFILVSALASVIWISFAIITQSLSFFFGNFEDSADRWLWTLFGLSLYPQTIFSGWLKIITVTVLPSFFIIYLPVELIKQFNWQFFSLLLGGTVFSFTVALIVFYKGLRRYESGNLINVRV